MGRKQLKLAVATVFIICAIYLFETSFAVWKNKYCHEKASYSAGENKNMRVPSNEYESEKGLIDTSLYDREKKNCELKTAFKTPLRYLLYSAGLLS
ncbi:MAG: hypothetical protein AAFV98_07975 [Chloroflexota bacterium]